MFGVGLMVECLCDVNIETITMCFIWVGVCVIWV